MSESSNLKSKNKFKNKIKKYLNFSDKFKKLSEEIADEAAERLFEAEVDESARTRKLTLEQRVKIAANACIRHSYTGYDDILIEKTIEQSYPILDDTMIEIKETDMDVVNEFIRKHRE